MVGTGWIMTIIRKETDTLACLIRNDPEEPGGNRDNYVIKE